MGWHCVLYFFIVRAFFSAAGGLGLVVVVHK